MRLFVALGLPAEVRDDLARAVERVRAGAEAGAGLRWAAPDRWHLTLAFLGEVPEARVATLRASLGRKADRHPPLALRLAGGGRFGRRVLWVGVTGDVERLARLADAMAAGARRAHVDADDRPFRPHLTVARSDGAADLRPMAEALAAYRGPSWTATTVELVRSRLGPRPAYESLDSWPLGDPPQNG